MISPEDFFDLSCPEGGSVYICEGKQTEFVGCCTKNPCGSLQGVCPPTDLRPMTYSKDRYLELPPLQCTGGGTGANDGDDAETLWWSCAFANPPFAGCCRSNPCVDLFCPAENLTQGELTTDSALRASFLSPAPLPSETGGGSSSTTAFEATEAPLASEDVVGTSDGGGSLSTGAVVGITVGAVVVSVVVAGILAYRLGWIAANKTTKRRLPATRSTGQLSQYRDSFGQDRYTQSAQGYYYPSDPRYSNKSQTSPMMEEISRGSGGHRPFMYNYGGTTPQTSSAEHTAIAGRGYHSRETSTGVDQGLAVGGAMSSEPPHELATQPEPRELEGMAIWKGHGIMEAGHHCFHAGAEEPEPWSESKGKLSTVQIGRKSAQGQLY